MDLNKSIISLIVAGAVADSLSGGGRTVADCLVAGYRASCLEVSSNPFILLFAGDLARLSSLEMNSGLSV